VAVNITLDIPIIIDLRIPFSHTVLAHKERNDNIKKKIILINILIVLTFVFGCNKTDNLLQQNNSSNDIRYQIPDILLQVSQKFGDNNPKNTGVVENKDYFILVAEGQFMYPSKPELGKASELNLTLTNDGKVTSVKGLSNKKVIWEYKGKLLYWQDFINKKLL